MDALIKRLLNKGLSDVRTNRARLINFAGFLDIVFNIIFAYDEEVLRLRNNVDEIVEQVSYAISIHAFHLDAVCKAVRFDVIVDFGLKDFEAFRRELAEKLEARMPGYTFAFRIDLDYSG
jgi:hypothetical protein